MDMNYWKRDQPMMPVCNVEHNSYLATLKASSIIGVNIGGS